MYIFGLWSLLDVERYTVNLGGNGIVENMTSGKVCGLNKLYDFFNALLAGHRANPCRVFFHSCVLHYLVTDTDLGIQSY